MKIYAARLKRVGDLPDGSFHLLCESSGNLISYCQDLDMTSTHPPPGAFKTAFFRFTSARDVCKWIENIWELSYDISGVKIPAPGPHHLGFTGIAATINSNIIFNTSVSLTFTIFVPLEDSESLTAVHVWHCLPTASKRLPMSRWTTLNCGSNESDVLRYANMGKS